VNKQLLFITPTHARPQRLDYIKRCIVAFQGLASFKWLVIEDGNQCDPEVQKILKASGINFIYLHHGPTRNYGNRQRNHALQYIRDKQLKGVVYLADDDNSYSPKLFDELRKVERAAILAVGLLGPRGIERPIVKKGEILWWDANWIERKYPVDTAAIAIDADLLQDIKGDIWDDLEFGGETEFLERFVAHPNDLEFLGNNCRRCYAWHNAPLNISLLRLTITTWIFFYKLKIGGFIRRILHLPAIEHDQLYKLLQNLGQKERPSPFK